MPNPYATGADSSPYDLRTFAYVPSGVPKKGGVQYMPEDIEDQHKVGICTAISTTQNARKALGVKFSADFQYLCQKKFYDKNWREGSSLSSALKVGKNIGFLPAKYWPFTGEDDRKLGYEKYIAKLQKISDEDIEKLKLLAADYKIKAYASVPIDRDLMAQAIIESESGILTRYAIGKEWWSKPIEPLRPPKVVVSGHAVTDSKYEEKKFDVVNTWGTDWANNGTARRVHGDCDPTEAWIPHYTHVPSAVQEQLEARKKVLGQIIDKLQKIVELYQQLNKLK